MPTPRPSTENLTANYIIHNQWQLSDALWLQEPLSHSPSSPKREVYTSISRSLQTSMSKT